MWPSVTDLCSSMLPVHTSLADIHVLGHLYSCMPVDGAMPMVSFQPYVKNTNVTSR